MTVGEFDLIDRYFRRESSDRDITLTVGDDGAVVTPNPGCELVAVVDTMVAGVHYPADMSPADIGWRLAAVNLSDIAAMGARPRWATLALTLTDTDERWLQGFSDGLVTALDDADATLVGGDTTSGSEVVMTLQLLGEVAAGAALRRDGAAAGDLVYLSGHPGDAAAGLRRFHAGNVKGDPLVGRFCRPDARVELGRSLASMASSAIDVSDGLLADVEKLARASAVAVTLDLDELPLSDPLKKAFPDEALSLALAGGDDYELCFTVSPGSEASVQALSVELGVPLTAIGRVEAGQGVTCRQGGQAISLDLKGYDHFREQS